jgi:site-specific DNA recombinase
MGLRRLNSIPLAEKTIATLGSERDALKAELQATPAASAVMLHPVVLARYEGQLARLQEVLAAGSAVGDTEAAGAIRDIVETVTVRPDPDRRGGVVIEIVGRLNALLRDSANANKQTPLSVGKVVAMARYIRQIAARKAWRRRGPQHPVVSSD